MKNGVLKRRALLLVCITLAFAAASLAAPITPGSFGLASNGVMAFANPGTSPLQGFLDFCPLQPGTPTTGVPAGCGTSPTNGGTFQAIGGTGYFSSIPGLPGVPGTIQDLQSQPVSATYTTMTPGVATTVNNLITVSTFPTLDFVGQMFTNPTCTATATQFCGNGFEFSYNPNTPGFPGGVTSVTLAITGTVIDCTGVVGTCTIANATPTNSAPFLLSLTGQYNNQNIPQVLALASSSTGDFSNSLSGTVNTLAGVPEPGSLGLLGLGLVGLGLAGKKIKARVNG